MTDRELLEAAAKAGDIGPFRGFDYGDPGSRDMAILIDVGRPAPQRWNPLADDGDALRLAVKLDLLQSPRFIHERDVLMFTRNVPKLEASRRAITSAAAEIWLAETRARADEAALVVARGRP